MKLEPVVVTLKPGQALRVELFETDGAFEIHYDTPDHKGCLVVKEADGLPDSYERVGILYCEEFGVTPINEATYVGDVEDDTDDGEVLGSSTDGLTWAIYSLTRKQWFNRTDSSYWSSERLIQCEFLENQAAHDSCSRVYHLFGHSEQLQVVRSDQKV
jgi:hypothetical protein